MVAGSVKNRTTSPFTTAILFVCVLSASKTCLSAKTNGTSWNGLRLFQLNSNGTVKNLTNNENIVVESKSDSVTLVCEYKSTKADENVSFTWSRLKYKNIRNKFQLTTTRSEFKGGIRKNSSVYKSSFILSRYDGTSAIACMILTKFQITVKLDYKLPPVVNLIRKRRKIICEVLSFKKFNTLTIRYNSDILETPRFLPKSNSSNVYRASHKNKFWGLFECKVNTEYGEGTDSKCFTPTGIIKRKTCEPLLLPTGEVCSSDEQCRTLNCQRNVCIRAKYVNSCRADDECHGYAERSVCKSGNCMCPTGESLRETDLEERLCVGTATVNHRCDKNSTCVDVNSICLNKVCRCLKGYIALSDQCVIHKTTSNENLPMFIGISVCVGVFIIVLVVMLIMKKAHLCELVPAPEERPTGRIFGGSLRASVFGSFHRRFLHRTPPPSYSRASKPPSYQEAMQMRQVMPELGTVLTIPCTEHNLQEGIHITENATSCIVSDSDYVESLRNQQQSNEQQSENCEANSHSSDLHSETLQEDAIQDSDINRTKGIHYAEADESPKELTEIHEENDEEVEEEESDSVSPTTITDV